MGIMVRNRAQYHESGLMEVQRRGVQQSCFTGSEQLQAEPRLPSGWEKCLDLKSGLIYFKDWNSGTLTYRDPRQQSVPLATQRIGLLSISLSPEQILLAASNEGVIVKRKTMDRFSSAVDEHSLELSLNLPGTPSTPRLGTTGSSQDGSVCTMEKVRSALERSQWLHSRTRRVHLPKNNSTSTPSSDPTTLPLLSSSNSPSCSRLYLESRSKSESAATSQCSSECFTSPSVMSYQGDDEEVQQPAECRDAGAKSQVDSSGVSGSSPVMMTVGCKSCLMYVMLSKSHPSCPKCGNTDVLLELPVPMPKKRRMMTIECPAWSWCTA